MQLDSVSEPGIEEFVFRDIFAKCCVCRMYMTRRTTMFHQCDGASEGVVAVTGEGGLDVAELTNGIMD